MNKLLLIALSVIITSTGISSSVYADIPGGWPSECGPQPAVGLAATHGPLTANPVGTSVTLNTINTSIFPSDVTFVLNPGIGSSTQVFLFVGVSAPIAAPFNGLSIGPHTAVVCYETVINTGHSNIVNFDITDEVVGGEIIPIEQTSLILAGAQSFSWMIPVVLSVLGIGLFVFRKSE